jgi:hypothetical protein
MRNEKTKMKLREISDSEFWLEGPYDFLTARFFVDIVSHEILYDVFSPKYDLHLKEENLRDLEKIDFIAEEQKKWKFAETAEDLWVILDEIKVWARKNNFKVKEKKII